MYDTSQKFMTTMAKKFISESTIQDIKKEADFKEEPPYDPRPLYQRLQESRLLEEEGMLIV